MDIYRQRIDKEKKFINLMNINSSINSRYACDPFLHSHTS